LRAELTHSRVDGHYEIVIASVHSHPFPIDGEFRLNFVSKHGRAHDDENGLVRDWLRFGVRALVRARFELLGIRAASPLSRGVLLGADGNGQKKSESTTQYQNRTHGSLLSPEEVLKKTVTR
jgi:hypothetical protein